MIRLYSLSSYFTINIEPFLRKIELQNEAPSDRKTTFVIQQPCKHGQKVSEKRDPPETLHLCQFVQKYPPAYDLIYQCVVRELLFQLCIFYFTSCGQILWLATRLSAIGGLFGYHARKLRTTTDKLSDVWQTF